MISIIIPTYTLYVRNHIYYTCNYDHYYYYNIIVIYIIYNII